MATEKDVRERFKSLRGLMDERSIRLWAGAEARSAGDGGESLVARATGLSRMTVRAGKAELARRKPPLDLVRVRRKGAGPKRVEERQPGILGALERLLDPVTRGDPESPLRWTLKSTRQLANELRVQGFEVSQPKVCDLLAKLGYSLQATSKTLEGDSHPDRDKQFRYINAQVKAFQARGQPVISVDAKKKELVGEFDNGGREWQPAFAPVLTNTYDFPDMAKGKALPYGVYDLTANKAHVSVGVDHDTPVFAVNAIETWWRTMGTEQYPEATELLVTADSGGSNGYRSRVWKDRLQKLATKTGLAITVTHFPPGTSKWNKIEHRLFSHISMNWRGRPLEDYETIVQLIGATKTKTGLKVNARLDRRRYRTGIKVPDEIMKTLNLSPAKFHGEWNYKITPCLSK
jgi:transposase